MKVTFIALISAVTMVVAEGHQHKHRHLAREGSPIEKRVAMVTETVARPTATIYELQNGLELTEAQAEEGIKEGIYVLIDETASATSVSVVASSTAVASTTPVAFNTTSSVSELADPVQLSVSLSITPVTPSTTAEPITTAEPSATAEPSTSAEASSTSSSATSTATGINEDFPSGTIECSVFPSAYGAVYIAWLNLEGWTGVQETPDYTPGDKNIVYIAEKTSGGCSANTFCSYACPAGYQKSQWPEAQGSIGESIGGLYCNADGYLEMSNSNFSTICIEGTGSISVVNNLADQVVICRTDYPGYESETIPLVATAGGTHPLTCPDASNYYTWKGFETSAQYYVNPAGATEAEACVWGESGTDLGNWAPVNFGVGMNRLGVTYISLIPNTPTNPDGVLNMTITIKGDTSGDCYYSNGVFYDSDGENADGCTVEVTGGSAYYEITEIIS